jgi:aromatic-ring opening dioxygenase LigAB LigA subunit
MIRRARHHRNRRGLDAPACGWLDKAGIQGQLRVSVSLYQVQKVLFAVNRDRQTRTRFLDDRERLLAGYELTAEERRALFEVDFHALYQMGVHSLLLGPLAATLGVSFPDYLAAIRGTKA